MTTYVFPGQGSQMLGMGGSLFSEFPEIIQLVDDTLGYSIKTLCLEDSFELLHKTEYTQPALYVVNALTYLKKLKDTGKKPDFVAGHSLGEFNALFAADVFDFETGLKLVQKRGDLMSQAKGGGMAAILGLKSHEVQGLLQLHNLMGICIANYNTHTQVVISGPKDDIQEAKTYFEKAGATFTPLKVSGAFHSPFMGSAQQRFAEYLRGVTFNSATIPIIANVNAKPYQLDDIYTNLAHQITYPVQWRQSIEYLVSQGETTFEEVGSGKILSGLIHHVLAGK